MGPSADRLLRAVAHLGLARDLDPRSIVVPEGRLDRDQQAC
jgi:hypothetical protein